MLVPHRSRPDLIERAYNRLLGRVANLHRHFLTLIKHDETCATQVRLDPYLVFDRRFFQRWELIRVRLRRVAARRLSLNNELSLLRVERRLSGEDSRG